VLISNATFGISNLYIVCVGLSLSLSPFCYIDRPDSPDSPDRTMAVSLHTGECGRVQSRGRRLNLNRDE
jgi:hypothetical protein